MPVMQLLNALFGRYLVSLISTKALKNAIFNAQLALLRQKSGANLIKFMEVLL
jgi:hypothetical protein